MKNRFLLFTNHCFLQLNYIFKNYTSSVLNYMSFKVFAQKLRKQLIFLLYAQYIL